MKQTKKASAQPARRPTALSKLRTAHTVLCEDIHAANNRIIELEAALADADAARVAHEQDLFKAQNQLHDAEFAIRERDAAVEAFRRKYFEAVEVVEAQAKAAAMQQQLIGEMPRLPHVTGYRFVTERLQGANMAQRDAAERWGEQKSPALSGR